MAFPSQIPLNFNDKIYTSNDSKLYGDYFREMIQRYGVRTYYYLNTYVPVSSAIHEYGEDQVTGFQRARPITMLVDIPNESILFSKFGLQTDADFTAIIHVKDWFNTFGTSLSGEPKAGDVVRILNTGWGEEETSFYYNSAANDSVFNIINKNASNICMPMSTDISGSIVDGTGTIGDTVSGVYDNGYTIYLSPSDGDWRRYPQMYQLTEVRYQDIGSGINFLMGHHVWLIRGRRFDYSYEPNIHPEPVKGGVIQPGGSPEDYTGGVVDDNDVIEDDSKDIFNYDDHPDSNNSPYGGY